MGKRTLLLAAVLVTIVGLTGGAFAQDPPGQPPPADPPAQPAAPDAEPLPPMITPESKRAVTDGLAFLVQNQNRDGSFGGRTSASYTIAITALSGLALVAGGNLPGRGPYGENVDRCIDYLLSTQGDLGFFSVGDDGSRTHGHGFVTLFLAQVLGMLEDETRQQRVKRSVMKAVEIIERSQTDEGGWGYVPDDRTWDEASTTVTLVQGLRAARDAGMKVRRDVIEKAIRYVHRCAMRVDWTDKDGKSRVGYTFKYSLKYQNNRSTFPLTAAAVSSLQGSGRYEGDVLQGGLDWINAFFHEQMQDLPNTQWYERFFYYSHFYAAQAMFHAPDDSYWNNYFPKVRELLLRKQSRNGSFASSYGEVYGTAIATLILEIPYGYLPIFQK